jgi:AcrR family transcriptional regulator
MARRAEKKQAIRDRLIAVATEKFCNQGYDKTTVDEIASAAGISQRTFFRYFPTKLAVAFPNAEESTRLLRENLERHGDPGAPLRGVIQGLLGYSRWYVGQKEQLLREWTYVSASASLVALEAEVDRDNEVLIAESLILGGVPGQRARILAGLIYGGVRATLKEWFIAGCVDDLLEVGGDLVTVLSALDPIIARLITQSANHPGNPT